MITPALHNTMFLWPSG